MIGSSLWARGASIARYFSLAPPPTGWRMMRGRCPHCGPTFYFSLGRSAFLTRCMRCAATVINLSLIPVIERHLGQGIARAKVYEMSSYGSTLNWLRRHAEAVTTSEYMPEAQLGSSVDGVRNEDVTRLTFPDASFDVVTSNQVMEHVPQDIDGYRECLRVLKPGGALIFSIPLKDIPATQRKAYFDATGALQLVGEPEYHDSRIGGAKSALVFWFHSRHDIAQRVKNVGFAEVKIIDIKLCDLQHEPYPVIYAVKAG